MEELFAASAETAMNELCRRAIRDGASDIHIEPGREAVRVRFRRDGLLEERFLLGRHMAEKLAVRCKVMGRMNVAETRVPQDGSAVFTDGGQDYDLRLSVLPSMYGETIVVRILSGRVAFIERNDLGMLPVQERAFLRCLAGRSGLILTTGPTGSGKTSTLYAAMKLLNRPEVNCISVEDPVEYRIDGVTQVAVNEKAGLTFAAGLRALVRQDPDVLMIGEIRDRETAEMAVHAALTGHLVLSSLHTNNAAEAPLRLVDMGVAPYLIAASLSLVLSQRLVRTLCPRCRAKTGTAYAAPGCEACGGTGRTGRTGIFELLEVTPRVRSLIHDMARPDALIQCMRDAGQPTMAEAAQAAAAAGRIAAEDAAWIADEAGEEVL